MPPLQVAPWRGLLARHAKTCKNILRQVSQAVENKIVTGSFKGAKLQPIPIPIRNTPLRPGLHHVARIRQSQSRWISRASPAWQSTVRHYASRVSQTAVQAHSLDRSAYLRTAIGSTVARSSARAPFASTLRPNLTGGTLNRTAGGYTLGSGRVGGARFFSHGPANPAQVIQNVSQALRAFLVSGQKAQFDGISTTNGEKRYRTISRRQHDVSRKIRNLPKATPGSSVHFSVNPSITALTSMADVQGSVDDLSGGHNRCNLNTQGLLDRLSTDFSRCLKDLAVIMSDLKRMSSLGDLPITCHNNTIRVHFPGCDGDTVETLCSDLAVQRGVTHQDAEFDTYIGTQMALLYPLTTSTTSCPAQTVPDSLDWRNMLSDRDSRSDDDSALCSTESLDATESGDAEEESNDGWSSEDFSSVDLAFGSHYRQQHQQQRHSPHEYQGVEGIYRFIQQCDVAVPVPIR